MKSEDLKRVVIRQGSKIRVLYTYRAQEGALKKKHELYAQFINDNFIPSKFSHAYTRKKSIYTNARPHLLNDIFIKIDVENFFPSINHRYLARQMHFELNRRKRGSITLKECFEIINSSATASIGLPLGLIPSPVLSNIYLKWFDIFLYGQLRKLKLPDVMYTRYADDIFISFKKNDPTNHHDEMISLIIDICKKELARCHLKINTSKTKVTDLSVGNHVKIAGVNIVRLQDGRRKLSVGRGTIIKLYDDALALYKSQNEESDARNYEIMRVKGMESFILSIEKKGYWQVYSGEMRIKVEKLGYANLTALIADLH